MKTFEARKKEITEEYKSKLAKHEARKRIYEAAYDMSREWNGIVTARAWWILFTTQKEPITRFKELMHKYFYSNPHFTCNSASGTESTSDRITIVVKDIEAGVAMDIDLAKSGLSTCKIVTKSVQQLKEEQIIKYICVEGEEL